MTTSTFRVLDISQFPAVVCRCENLYPGYGSQWQAELEALIETAQPFYLLFAPGDFSEEAADTRLRAIWLKANKSVLAKVCKSILSIEPDEEKRGQLQTQNEGMEKAFGIPRLVARGLEEAHTMGNQTLQLSQSN